jgi:hypothetical protein
MVVADAIGFTAVDRNAVSRKPSSTVPYKPSPSGTIITSRDAHQSEALAFLKQHFQPTWEKPRVLPWKQSPKTGIIKGVVTSADGTPIYNAKVKLAGSVSSQQTEPHGRFALFDLNPGGITIEISARGYQNTSKNVRTTAGQIAAVKVILAPLK